MLFKIGRKLSTSGAISSVYEIYDPPFAIKILFFVIGFNFGNKKNYKKKDFNSNWWVINFINCRNSTRS